MPEVLVKEADIADYRRDGAVVLRNVLDKATLELIERGVEEAYSSPRAGIDVADEKSRAKTRVRDYASVDSPSLQKLFADGRLGRLGAALMGTTSAHRILDQVFYKEKGAILPTPWHQDTGFLRVRGEELVRLWVPCDRSPKELTVQVVRGSHRWNVVYNTAIEDPATAMGGAAGGERPVVGDSWSPGPPDVAAHRDSFDILSWDVEPGDVLAFQGNMLHGADGHPGYDRSRRALAVLMGGPALSYYRPSGKAFPSPGRVAGVAKDDVIPNGAPIGDYPMAFPAC